MNQEKKEIVDRLLLEKISLRGIGRSLGISVVIKLRCWLNLQFTKNKHKISKNKHKISKNISYF